jgi:hypothetical protein
MLYKNVKFSPHLLETIKPSPPHPKKTPLELQNPHVPRHFISTEPNFEKTPSTPTQKTIPWKERKEKIIQPFI